MLRPIFIACGTPFCQAARAQSSVTLYGSLTLALSTSITRRRRRTWRAGRFFKLQAQANLGGA